MKLNEMTEVRVCPLCNAESFLPFEEAFDQELALSYKLCGRCGLVFQSPMMDEANLAAYYARGYREEVQGSELPTAKDLRLQIARAQRLGHLLQGYIEQPSIMLDIGSSSGVLLSYYQETFQSRSIGVEPGDGYRSWSQNRGLEVYKDVSALPEDLEHSIDLVSMVHVLEHLSNPVHYLKDLTNRWLKEEGLLMVEVPNLFGHHAFERSHLLAFSSRTLCQLLEAAGFEVLESSTHGHPRSPILRLYITVLARRRDPHASFKKPRYSARGVQWRRRLGSRIREFLTEKLPSRTWLPWPDVTHKFLEGMPDE